MKSEYGFTLLELMVAMAIFAMLAVAGWQVFDGVNRARERAQVHADNLATLQYAYLQLQQDMAQVIPYQAPNANELNSRPTSTNEPSNEVMPEPYMSVDDERVDFVRFNDPDPRYQISDSVQRIEYVFADNRLIRRQYVGLEASPNDVSLDSVLLEGVTAGRWQAYVPELSSNFPNSDASNSNSTSNSVALLPTGVAVSFTYQDMPITWQWALTPKPTLSNNGQNLNKNVGNNSSDTNNNNSDVDNNDTVKNDD